MLALDNLISRCIAERRERAIQRLVAALDAISGDGPEKKPKAQPGSDRDPLLAYEDGVADASFSAARTARAALAEWDSEQ